MKRVFLSSLFLLSSLFAMTPTFEMGSTGFYHNFDNSLEEYSVTLGTPIFHLKEEFTGLMLSFQLGEYTSRFNSDINSLNLLETRLMWSPIKRREIVLGPFIDIAMGSIMDGKLASNTGIKFTYLGYLGRFDLPKDMALRIFDIEAGYSITAEDFYIKISADPLILGTAVMVLYIESLN